MKRKIDLFNKGEVSYEKLFQSFQGWGAYAKWGDSYILFKRLVDGVKNNDKKMFFNKQQTLLKTPQIL